MRDSLRLVSIVVLTSFSLLFSSPEEFGVHGVAGETNATSKSTAPGKNKDDTGEVGPSESTARKDQRTPDECADPPPAGLAEKQGAIAENGTAPQSLVDPLIAGPWEIIVTSFKTHKEFEFVLGPLNRRKLTAKGDAVIAVIELKCNATRAYTKGEEEQIAKGVGLPQDFAKYRGALGKDGPFLTNTLFQLGYVDTVAEKRSFVLSQCVGMECAMTTLNSTTGEFNAGFSELSKGPRVVTVAFQYGESDRNPFLIFRPIPGEGEMYAIRISIGDDGKITLESDTLERLKKHIPDDLKAPQIAQRAGESPTSVPSPPTFRVWKDATDKFSVNARFMSLAGGKVKLETDKGRVVEVQVERLSGEDQTFLKTLTK